MIKNDLLIIILFFWIFFSLILTLYEIYRFMPIIKTCEDDFAIVNKCGCVPCSWKNAEELNRNICFDFNKINLSNG